MWLRPRSLKHTPIKEGSNPKWGRDEAHYAMPVHTRVHQVITVALLDSDSGGDDEIGRSDTVMLLRRPNCSPLPQCLID